MKQLFNIAFAEPQSADLLICEISHYHICLAGAQAAGGMGWLRYYEKAAPLTQADFESLLQREVPDPAHYQSFLMGSAFPDATLVPQQLAEEKGLHAFLKYGTDVTVFADDLPEQQLQVVYTIPATFYKLLPDSARTMHVHTAAIKMLSNNNGYRMALHFTSKEFRVVAMKDGAVQLAQIYPFTAPLDVVYYLLMISEQYGMPQSETVIELAGLVDESSALYKELYQYYTQVQFAAPAPFEGETNGHQPHFFSSIFNLAACASSVVS